MFFDAPAAPLTAAQFARALGKRGARLDIKTQMLYRGRRVFINGESAPVPVSRFLKELADTRHVPSGARLAGTDVKSIYPWYMYGWLHLYD